MSAALFKNLAKNRGSLLVAVVVLIMIVAGLGTAIFTMDITTTISRVWTGSASKAYYLAESGFRYIRSQYQNTSDTDGDGEVKDDRNQLLIDWNSPDPPASPVLFSFNGGNEKFEYKFYPYFLVTGGEYSKGDTSISTKFPGTKPVGITVPAPTGKIKIGTDPPYSYSSYNSSTGSFSISTPLASNIGSNTDVYLVTQPSASQTISNGGNLLLDDVSFFPKNNGIFRVEGQATVYGYQSADYDTNVLQDIYEVADREATFSLTVSSSDDVIANPFVELHSIGIVEQGSTYNSKKENVYLVPLTTDAPQKIEFKDTFEDKSNWQDSTYGDHTIKEIGGNKALKVTGTQSLAGSPKASLIALKSSATKLATAYKLGNPNYLNYDAQIKVGFEDTPYPDGGFDPSPIPKYYGAGLSFRLDNDNNSYGLSFLRGDNTATSPYDNIDNNLVPANYKSLIVLWQQTNGGSTPKWIAYKELEPIPKYFFQDDMESGSGKWQQASGLWHISSRRWDRSGSYWYYGREWTGTYDTGARTTGSIVSENIDLCYATSATLSYWTYFSTETQQPADYDLKYVEISTNGGASWQSLETIRSSFSSWSKRTIDLSSYLGDKVLIRFRFDTLDNLYNNYEGWYVDDVQINGDLNIGINESTLLVRMTEAASIDFYNGGTTEVETGDLITGQTSGAWGLVSEPPILSSGSWAGGNAAGTLVLRNVSTGVDFVNGEELRAGANNVGRVQDYVQRANLIRSYFGDPSGCGTPDANLLNLQRGGNPRGGDLNWPPEKVSDWAADTDNFTLIQWDAINTANVPTAGVVSSENEPNAIVRSTQSELLSPDSGTFTQPELGLHTFGKGSENVYFDDFGLLLNTIETGGFLPSIQK